MAIGKLGGKNGDLKCQNCGNLRYPLQPLCIDCWGKENPGRGVRNSRGVVIQQKLPYNVFMATQFAANMVREGKPLFQAITIASKYYEVEWKDVQYAMAQRSARNRKFDQEPKKQEHERA